MTSTSQDRSKYGRYAILKEIEPRLNSYGKKQRMVLCECDCGNHREVQLSNLKSGNSVSCGCHRKEMMAAENAKRSIPQEWTIIGDTAYLVISDRKVSIDAADIAIVGQYRWHITHWNYVASMGLRKEGKSSFLHRLILGLDSIAVEGDHINHDPLDNRRCNLRIATSSQNKMNTRKQRNNSNLYKGITKNGNAYVAHIGVSGKPIHLGRFKSAEDAATAYNFAAEKYYGEFAYFNYPIQECA